MIIDEVTLKLKAGKGGDGVVRWRREKYIDKGGPYGGDGGRGGDIYLVAVNDMSALLDYKNIKEFKAEDGQPGGYANREGAAGKDLYLRVPVGSVITDLSTGEVFDLDKEGQTILIAKGGRGGLGNSAFKSSTNTTPYEWTPGEPGEEKEIKIDLKYIADIGLVGLPNAGKSSFLNAITNAKSKVAGYAFTTLEPHLGVTKSGLIVADIPGLIKGAHTGKGLGKKFLKHIERARVLVHMVSSTNEDVLEAYDDIRNELEQYGQGLSDKKEIVILSKIDEVDEEQMNQKLNALKTRNPDTIPLTLFDDTYIKNALKFIETTIKNM